MLLGIPNFGVVGILSFAFYTLTALLDDLRRIPCRAPFTRYLGSSFSVDASVQIHNDIDRCDKDLGCDQDDD